MCESWLRRTRTRKEAVESGELRGDLFYRLNVFNIQMPALREHRGDVKVIAEKNDRRHERAARLHRFRDVG